MNALKDAKLNKSGDVLQQIINIDEAHNSCQSKCCKCLHPCNLFISILNYSYDILTICISISDVVTDVLVIYDFKIKRRHAFFIIALIVMILAQLSYFVAFMIRFAKDSRASHGQKLLLFLCALPLTPVMSFIFFWLSFENNCIIERLEHYGFFDSMYVDATTNKNQAPILVWVETKLVKHLGFVMEAIIEALPQSIIQLIAIVYYQDTQILNIISICISLTSIATKTLVCSVAIDFRVFIFNWLSLVCDFFGIFAIILWVFYNPNNPGEITLLGQIWIVKAVIIWIMMSVFIGGPICIMSFHDDLNYEFEMGFMHAARIRNHGRDSCRAICKKLLYCLGSFGMWILGSVLGIVFCEIMFCTSFAFKQWSIAHKKFLGHIEV